jgi:hypothetical protein
MISSRSASKGLSFSRCEAVKTEALPATVTQQGRQAIVKLLPPTQKE